MSRRELDAALAAAEMERAQSLATTFGTIVAPKGGWTSHVRPFGHPHALCGKKHPMPSRGSTHFGRAGWKAAGKLTCAACAKRVIELADEQPPSQDI